MTRPEGTILFSSYAEKFWKDRLEWFQIQADQGLIGEINYNKTRNGNVICKDGFTATTFSGNDFLALSDKFNLNAQIYEVDNSSVFCEINVN